MLDVLQSVLDRNRIEIAIDNDFVMREPCEVPNDGLVKSPLVRHTTIIPWHDIPHVLWNETKYPRRVHHVEIVGHQCETFFVHRRRIWFVGGTRYEQYLAFCWTI